MIFKKGDRVMVRSDDERFNGRIGYIDSLHVPPIAHGDALCHVAFMDESIPAKAWADTEDLTLYTQPLEPDPADPVDHPAHYTSDPSGVECITVTRHRNFNIGNAIKYLWRAGLKNDQTHIEDLEKAIWYIRDEIQRLKDQP